MARRDDPGDPSRRLERVVPPGLEERVRARLADQLGFYDRRAHTNQRWYRGIKLAQLVAAALVPVVAGLGVSAWLTGGLGSAIVVMEGVQQLYQFPGALDRLPLDLGGAAPRAAPLRRTGGRLRYRGRRGDLAG